MRLILALFVTAAILPAAESMTLTLRGDDWPPYNTDPKAEKPGFLIEIAKAVFEPKGYTVDYQLSSWVRAMKDARDGNVDILVGAGTSDAEGLLVTKAAQGYSDNHFYTLPESTWTFADAASLNTVTLGVVKDYTYTPVIDERIASKKRIMEVSGDRPLHQLLKLLDAKRADVLVENQLVMNWTLQALNKSQVVRDAGSVQQRDNIYLALSAKRPGSTKNLEILETGMAEMTADGRLAAIYARYGVPVTP